jgi:ferritin
MMISQTMNNRINDQIASEFHASQTYLSMACMFDGMGLKAVHEFFRKQSEEEREHALKFVNYLLDVGAKVVVQEVPAPPSEFPSVTAAIEAALEHERRVTEQINGLVEQAQGDKDHASFEFLQWFVQEQVEEVSSMQYLLDVANLAGKNLLQFDACVRHLLARPS